MTSLDRESRDERGAVAIEFALIFTILAMLLFGSVEFGLFFSRFQVYQGAAREGARLAATRASASEINERVQNAAAPYNGEAFGMPATVTVTVSGGNGAATPCDSTTRGEEVTVAWTHNFKDAIALPFIPDISFSSGISGVFRCE